MPAVENQRHVDIDDVAVLERLVGRDAVADHVVDRGAGRLAVAAIHQGRRRRLVVHGELEHQTVDCFRRHAGFDHVGQHVEALGRELAGLAHAGEGRRAVQLDLSGLALWRQRRVDIAHQGIAAAPPPGRLSWGPLLSRNVSNDAREASRYGFRHGLAEPDERLVHDRHRFRHVDALPRDAAAIGDGLDAGIFCHVERPAVGRVDVAGERKTPRRTDLDQEQHHRAGALCRHVGQLGEVLRPALGDRVGEFRECRAAHQVDVLDLDIARRPRRVFEQEIDARIPAVFHLAARAGVAREFCDRAGRDCFGGDARWDGRC